MIKVKFFGVLRLNTGTHELTAQAYDVASLLKEINKQTGLDENELKNFVIFVNDKNIVSLKLFKTKLSDGDVVTVMSPVSGG